MPGNLTAKIIVSALSLVAASLPCFAQEPFPSKLVRIVVPYPAGGSTDFAARVVADELTVLWGKQVIVENRFAGKGSVGIADVAKSAPDGHTMLFVTSGITIDATLRADVLPYNVKDLLPVINVAETPYLLVVNNHVPARSLREFVDYARSKSGQLKYATAGMGSTSHMIGELFETRENADMKAVPYKSFPESFGDLMNDLVQAMFPVEANVQSLLSDGKARALGIASRKRSPTLPNVPTFEEAGLKDWNQSQWYGIFVPLNTTEPMMEKLNSSIVTALKNPMVVDKLRRLGVEPVGNARAEFSAEVNKSVAQWKDIITRQGIKSE